MPEEQPKPAAPRCLIRSAILYTAAKDKTGSCLAEARGCLAPQQKHARSAGCGQPQAQTGEREEEEEVAAHGQCQASLLQQDLPVVG